MELLLATGNAGKAREFEQMLGGDFNIRAVDPLMEETGASFAENAILKALAVARLVAPSRCDGRTAQRAVATLVIADDSGLEVDSLGGAPGIFSARYASGGDNIERLLRELADKRDRAARFRCVIALTRGGEVLATFEGVVEGVIVDLARGRGGFGYDPVFQPNGFDKTFGELPGKIKNQISHRARAIKQLAEFLRTLGV
jgi:XTP/dITP diphosphohydrolase